MNIILLSGGSGKRLWPLSNDIRSKQFIRMLSDGQGGFESMLGRVYRQISAVDPGARITIATGRKQVSLIKNQLGDRVNVCVEPCRRDTFPAVSLAASYLRDVQGVEEDEPVVVCPVDPYVEEPYFRALHEMAQMAGAGGANLYLMGIEPTYPSEKYGYIIPASSERVSGVDTFREKPDLEKAQTYPRPGSISPRGHSGTAACSPSGWAICWRRPMSAWSFGITRICSAGTGRWRRSASTMRWRSGSRRSGCCASAASGRTWAPGTLSLRPWRTAPWGGPP